MRPKISKSNIKYFIRQEYGFTSLNQFFEYAKNSTKIRNKIVEHIVKEFTSYTVVKGQLGTFNPYTSKLEFLKIQSFEHITSTDDLLKDLSMLHKTRMDMLTQSRKRILELSKTKKKTRDQDLKGEQQDVKISERTSELEKIRHKAEPNNELEQ